MEETARQVTAYLQASPFLNLVIACLSGFAASKAVASESRSNWLLSLVIGLLGFFLAEFVIFFFGFVEYLDQLEPMKATRQEVLSHGFRPVFPPRALDGRDPFDPPPAGPVVAAASPQTGTPEYGVKHCK